VDITGRSIRMLDASALQTGSVSIDLKDLPAGYYYAVLRHNGQPFVKGFVKQ